MFRLAISALLAVLFAGTASAGDRPTTEPSNPVTRIYDMRGLVAAGEVELARLAELVTDTIAPDSWATKPSGVTISPDGRSLSITQTPANHGQIVRLLELLTEVSSPTPFGLIIHVVAADPTRLPAGLRERLKPGLADGLSDEELRSLLSNSVAYTPITGEYVFGWPIVVRDTAGAVIEQIPADASRTLSAPDFSMTIIGGIVRPVGMQCEVKLRLSKTVGLEVGALDVSMDGGENVARSVELLIPENRSAVLVEIPANARAHPPLRLYVFLRPTIRRGSVRMGDLNP